MDRNFFSHLPYIAGNHPGILCMGTAILCMGSTEIFPVLGRLQSGDGAG